MDNPVSHSAYCSFCLCLLDRPKYTRQMCSAVRHNVTHFVCMHLRISLLCIICRYGVISLCFSLCFFQFCASPLVPWLGWIILKFQGFCRQTFAHFLQLALAVPVRIRKCAKREMWCNRKNTNPEMLQTGKRMKPEITNPETRTVGKLREKCKDDWI